MASKLTRVRVSEDLRQRVTALTIENESDQRMVDRYLAPDGVVFQSNIDFLESLAHPARMGRKFVLNSQLQSHAIP